MRVSVIIPAYNSSSTIQETLDSVLRQTVQPDEVLVMDDGSTDGTAALVSSYAPHVTLMRQENRGLGATRDVLCAKATGDLIAFLDSDDLWHPRYIEVQRQLFLEHPNCVAFFVGHLSFFGDFRERWEPWESSAQRAAEILSPVEFLMRVNYRPGPFGISYCCVPKAALNAVGFEPFKLRMAEDLHFHLRRAPLGPVVYLPMTLAAYRLRSGSLSSNSLALAEAMTGVFERLEVFYDGDTAPLLRKAFRECFALKRRHYAKHLLGSAERHKARKQLLRAITCCGEPRSVVKSLALLLLSGLPVALQPAWPSPNRECGADAVLVARPK
jgi:glycosyltransferase involved in cell wall biosynthesis